MSRIIAIDFDGTLFGKGGIFPAIGEPNWQIINTAKQHKRNGDKLILYTMREGEFLDAAVKACAEVGLIFDAVNDNLPEHIENYGKNSRKIFFNELWEDKQLRQVVMGEFI